MKYIRSVIFVFILIGGLVFAAPSHAFNQPWALNMGTTSFMDGGPEQPRRGLFFNQYVILVQSDAFLDERGRNVTRFGNINIDVNMSNWIFLSQLIYLSNWRIFGANLGAELIIPYVDLNFKYTEQGAADLLPEDGSGMSDLCIGPFLQWDPVKFDNGMVFVHRFELQSLVPTGRYDNRYMANPSANFYSFNPYWAATLYLSRRLSVSTRLHYVWHTKNDDPYSELNVKEARSGQAFHCNFAASYQVVPRLLSLGISGYYLRQTSDSKFVNKGTPTPEQELMKYFLGSRQEVLGIGPGALIFFSKNDGIFLNAYFESNVESRPRCRRYQIRWVHQF